MLLKPCLAFAVLLSACSGGDTGEEAGPADAGILLPADAAVVPEPTAGYVFDDSALRTYELTVNETDLAWLNSNILLEEYVPATLRFEGEVIGEVGLRYKGGFGTLQSCVDAAGNKTCDKLSMKLKFSEFDKDLRFYGLKKINFHSMNSDPSHLHDRLAYYLFRSMGVAAPRAVHAKLVINGESQGLFALIEQVDGRFTKNRFTDGGNGNLYKEVWPVHQTAQPYLNALKTNEDDNPDVGPMLRFASDLASATDATIEAVLADWMDLDGIMSYLAVDRAIENWDGIVGFWCVNGNCGNHNFLWYQGQTEDKVTLIPWDMDNTFDSPNFFLGLGQPVWNADPVDCTPVDVFEIDGLGMVGRRGASCDSLLRGLGVTMRDRYHVAVARLLDGPFEEGHIATLLDGWEAQLADAVADDAFGPGTVAWQSELATLRAAIATLRGQMQAEL